MYYEIRTGKWSPTAWASNREMLVLELAPGVSDDVGAVAYHGAGSPKKRLGWGRGKRWDRAHARADRGRRTERTLANRLYQGSVTARNQADTA